MHLKNGSPVLLMHCLEQKSCMYCILNYFTPLFCYQLNSSISKSYIQFKRLKMYDTFFPPKKTILFSMKLILTLMPPKMTFISSSISKLFNGLIKHLSNVASTST
jgi:hypothetical protein